MTTGEDPPSNTSGSANPLIHRQSRWLGQGYADITKLRELAAKHDRAAGRMNQRASRINTKIEKLRHQSTVLREKAHRVLMEIPEIEQQMKQHERDIQAGTNRAGGAAVGSDITDLHYRVRKLQQKVVDRQQKARTIEHHAAIKTQKTAELKVKVDRYLEAARVEEQEAAAYRQRADRLQMVTETDVASNLKANAASGAADDGSRTP
jgi:predicted  nucleic acid-binding Zn-ribbon protein